MISIILKNKRLGFFRKVSKSYYHIFDKILGNGTAIVGLIAFGVVSTGLFVSPNTEVSAGFYQTNLLGTQSKINETKVLDLSEQFIMINGEKYEIILKIVENESEEWIQTF